MRVEFIVEVGSNEMKNYKGSFTYEGDYESICDELSFSISDIIKGDIGSTDIFDLKNFASKYMSAVYEEEYLYTMESLSDEFTASISENPNGRKFETFSISTMENFGAGKMISPELSVYAFVTSKKDEVTDYSISLKGTSGIGMIKESNVCDFKALYPSLIAKMKMLLGEDFDLSPINYENTLKEDGKSKNGDEIRLTGNYFGSEAKVDIEYDFCDFTDAGNIYYISFEIYITKKK